MRPSAYDLDAVARMRREAAEKKKITFTFADNCAFVRCSEHDRYESLTQRINELTQHYIEDHPEMIEALFAQRKKTDE